MCVGVGRQAQLEGNQFVEGIGKMKVMLLTNTVIRGKGVSLVDSNLPSKKMRVLVGAHMGFPVGGISINYESLLTSDFINKVNVTFVETSKGSLSFHQRGKHEIINLLNAGENIFRFTKVLIQVKPDIVHLGTASGLSLLKHASMAVISRLLRYPVIMCFHFSFTEFRSQEMLSHLTHWMLGYCNGAVIISSEWQKLENLYPKMRIKLIPNAINTKLYADIERPRNDQDNPIVHLLYLGHLGQDKGIYELLDAIRVLNEKTAERFILDLYGESLEAGDDGNITAIIRETNLSDIVRIHHPVYGEDKKQVFAMSDVFVLPSYHEGMPISIIEAMASGLPVIATKVGGIVDQVVEGETGYLIRPKNVDELFHALLKLIEDRELRIRMGNAGRERAVKIFDINTKIDALLTFHKLVRKTQIKETF